MSLDQWVQSDPENGAKTDRSWTVNGKVITVGVLWMELNS